MYLYPYVISITRNICKYKHIPLQNVILSIENLGIKLGQLEALVCWMLNVNQIDVILSLYK